MSSAQEFVTPFLGALQAALAVLLTIFYGAIAAQFDLLSEYASKEVSKTCVRLFLPALLIHNVGSQLHLDTGLRYVPIFLWAIIYNVVSIGIGFTATRLFKLPEWVTPALAFNNTTSLPLLLVQSLDATGILGSILMSSSDSSSDAVKRAQSYFLVNAMVSNSLTFALGPKLLNGQEEDPPDKPEEKKNDDEGENEDSNGNGAQDVEQGEQDEDHRAGVEQDEHSSLLPNGVGRRIFSAQRKLQSYQDSRFSRLPPWLQKTLNFLYQFLNAPFIGAVIGAIIGLTPALHRVFFNSTEEGGYLNAWLTSSIKNIGDLFAALQVIVVGVKLSQAMRKMKNGEASGRVPWRPMMFITFVRFVLWPAISIPLVWVLAKKTGWLDNDPILWFAMMLMPTGPPAMKLTALADVNGSDENEKMSIAKFLTISYAMSPLICFSVVGSLKASEAAMGK